MRNLLLILLVTTGCQENIYFSDDEGGPRHDTSATGEHDDEMSLPYALGTTVGLSMKGPVGNAAGWRLVSDAPAIFAVTTKINDDGSISGTGSALAEGDALIRALDANGSERRSVSVSIRAADRARLFSHGDLRVVANDDQKGYDAAEVSNVHILAGGRAVLAVAYYKGQTRLFGRGIAQTGDATVQNMTSTGGATNEWLFISPTLPGDYTVNVKQGAVQLASLAVTAVPESSLAGIALDQEGGGSRSDKDQVWVLARANDTGGNEVLGVYCGWTLDGAAQKFGGDDPNTQGDLYRYHFAGDGTVKMLTAQRGALTASLAIPAHDGSVNDTTYLGCSMMPGVPGRAGQSTSAAWAFAALFLFLIIRNSARRSGRVSPESQAPATNERGR